MSNRFIAYLVLLSVVFLMGLIKYKHLSLPFKYLWLLMGITLISESLSGYLSYQHQSSLPVYHFLSCIEYAGIAMVFSGLYKNKILRRTTFYSIIPVSILGILNSVYLQDMNTFPSNVLLLSHGIFLLFALLLFKQMIDEPIEKKLYKQSQFWLSTAYLIFPAAVFLSFGLQNYFIRNQLNMQPINNMIYISNFVFYILIGIALLTDQKETSFNVR